MSPRRRLRAKLIATVLIILLIVAGVFAAVHYSHRPGKRLTPEQQAANQQVAGNYDAAQKIYDKKLAAATTKQEKAAAYTGKSTIAVSAKDYKSALQYALKADQLDPTSVTAESLGGIEELLGDKAAAAKYYKIAIGRIDPKTPVGSYELSQAQNMLNRVTQQ